MVLFFHLHLKQQLSLQCKFEPHNQVSTLAALQSAVRLLVISRHTQILTPAELLQVHSKEPNPLAGRTKILAGNRASKATLNSCASPHLRTICLQHGTLHCMHIT